MWQAIAGIIQILFLIFKNKFEKDAERRKEQKEMYEESKKAIASGNVSAISSVLVKLRK